MNKFFLSSLRSSLMMIFVAMVSIAASDARAINKADRSDPAGGFKIIQFLGDKKAGEFALVGANASDGIGMGVLLKAYRPVADHLGKGRMWVETGELKVVGNRNGYAFAQLKENGSTLSKEIFKRHSGPMAGDRVVPSEIKITRQSTILPIVELSYFGLFDDPRALPSSFELSPDGEKLLAAQTQEYAKARVAMVIVEGHTSEKGASEANQIESYERAKTVRQYLISSYGLDPKRVLAIGYGESAPKDKNYTAGHEKRNRRIIVKAVEIDESLID